MNFVLPRLLSRRNNAALSVLALCLAVFLSPVALAQSTTARPATDWKKLGNPVDDDSKSMLDRYVYFDDATTDKNVVLSKPVISSHDMEEWLKSHLGQIMTLDGRHFDAQITQNGSLFTPRGFADYVMYLNDANMKKFLADNQLKVLAYVEGTPEITTHGLRDENAQLREKDPSIEPKLAYVWQANATVILSYLDYSNRPPPSLFPQKDPRQIMNRFPVKARIEITRVPMQEDGNLVGINRVRFSTK